MSSGYSVIVAVIAEATLERAVFAVEPGGVDRVRGPVPASPHTDFDFVTRLCRLVGDEFRDWYFGRKSIV